MFTQKAAALDQPSQEPSKGKMKNEIRFGTVLSMQLLKLPDVLRKCDIGKQQEEMLMDSIKSMGRGVDLKMETPGKEPSHEEVAEHMRWTVDSYANKSWYDFGSGLGKLLQGAVLIVFDKKY